MLSLFTLFGLCAMGVLAESNVPLKTTATLEQKPWLGLWIPTGQDENWEAFIKAIDLPSMHPDKQPIIKLEKEGHRYRLGFSVPEENFEIENVFTLGQELEEDLNGKKLLVTVTEDKNDLIIVKKIPEHNKEVKFTFTPMDNGELLQTAKIGAVVAKRHLRKYQGLTIVGKDSTVLEKPWFGTWISTDRQENWDAFVKTLNSPSVYSSLDKIIHKYRMDGNDLMYEIQVPDKNLKFVQKFSLGQEIQVTYNKTQMGVTLSESGNDLAIALKIPGKTSPLNMLFKPQGDEAIKTYKFGSVVAKRFFKKEKSA